MSELELKATELKQEINDFVETMRRKPKARDLYSIKTWANQLKSRIDCMVLILQDGEKSEEAK